jgi:4-hydroxy-tetrahydrodipicolinate synthase
VEPNPIPLKWAMDKLGLCGPTMRLPMTPLSAANQSVVEAALQASSLL